MRTFFSDDSWQQALSFLTAQTTIIEPTVIRMKYPELNYADLVPVDGTGPEWAKSVTFFSVEQIGAADFYNHLARDIPFADVMRRKHESAIEMAAVGYRYTLEELNQAMSIPGYNLGNERAAAAKRAYEEMCHGIALYGDSRKNWMGLTNHSAISVINCGTTWATSIAAGTQAGIDAVLQSINGCLTNVWQASNTVEMANTLLLPLTCMGLLATHQLLNTESNLLAWVRQNNIYTQQTGAELMVRAVRGLDTAGASGNGRMIAYTRDPENIKFHRPMAHRFLSIWQSGPMTYDVPGIFRLAGIEIRRPGALRYVDGVC